VLLLIVTVLRPRLGRLPRGAAVVDRARAPRLYGLIDRVAAEAGTRGVDVIVLDGVTNASVSEYGPRRRRMLRLGLPLWHTLTPQQRVALLGHELGHYANGDHRHGLVVGTALNTLGTWLDVLRPNSGHRRDLTHTLANWLIAVPWFVVLCLIRLLDHFTLRASQRAEYRADAIAARVGSTEAAAELFDRLLVLPSVDQELRRQAILARTRNRGSDPKAVEAGLWSRLADHARTVTDHEWERLRRVSVRRGHSTDSTPSAHAPARRAADRRPAPERRRHRGPGGGRRDRRRTRRHRAAGGQGRAAGPASVTRRPPCLPVRVRAGRIMDAVPASTGALS
jgi:hypothetical protein